MITVVSKVSVVGEKLSSSKQTGRLQAGFSRAAWSNSRKWAVTDSD